MKNSLKIFSLFLLVALTMLLWVGSKADWGDGNRSFTPASKAARTVVEKTQNPAEAPPSGAVQPTSDTSLPAQAPEIVPAVAPIQVAQTALPSSSSGVPQNFITLPLASTREQVANGSSVAGILENVTMSDPLARAEAIEAIRLLEDRQSQAVTLKARQLAIPTRLEGPDHQLSLLYDFRGDEPLYRTTLNKNAAISSGANLLYPFPYNLDGTGIKVGIWDGGSVRASHQEFGSRVTIRNPGSAIDNHATHVAGTIGAAGIDPNAKGMAPKVRIDSYNWFSDFSEMTAAGAISAGETSRIPLSNHSYGYFGNISDMGRYQAEARDTDAIAARLPYYLIFWAAGNEQNDLTSLGGFQSITFNGLAKNIMTIGAVEDAVAGAIRSPAAGIITSFSSLGPSDDGRIKPDLVGNGRDVYSTVGTSDNAYDGTYSGTSMATPNVMGSAALITQLYAREFSGKRMPASTLKSLLIHTADDLGNPGPDYTYGWGLINVKAAADLIIAHKNSLAMPKIIDGQLTNANKTRTHTFIWDGISPIRATLAWTDPAGVVQNNADSRAPNLRHNLDAKITAPDGTTLHQPYVMPFVGTWTQASMSALATPGTNNVDNIEQVFLATPTQFGHYTVTVSVAANLNPGVQNYSLIITGGQSTLSNPPPNVTLTAPADWATFLPAVAVTLAADALDFAVGGIPGVVSQVEFFNGETLIGVDTTAPYSLSWTPPVSGTFLISVKATDSDGASATSTIATINVVFGDGVPVVTSFTPTNSNDGSRVTLLGSNFVGLTNVKFNGVDTTFTADSSTQISTVVPPSAVSGLITVTNPFGSGVSSNSFTVYIPPILISQVFAAGGSSGIIPRQDYIELYNRSSSAVSLAGWSVQYAAATSTFWQVAPLSGTIAPGKFYLLALASSATGFPLMPPDASALAINLSKTGGKIALLNTAAALSGSAPLETIGMQDFLGYGNANGFEGSPASAPNDASLYRVNASSTDTGDNSTDFIVANPAARNSSSALTPIITSSLSQTSLVNTNFTYSIVASFAPTNYGATSLPTGLTINSATGVISGTPTVIGIFPVTLSARNTGGTATATLMLTITPPPLGGVVNLFAENIGINGGITSIASNPFQNISKSFTGSADGRNNLPSTNYAGASGGRNIYFAQTGNRNFIISGITTTGFTNLVLSFGHYKSESASSTQLVVEVSGDGFSYTPLSYVRASGGAGIWQRVTATGTIPATDNLSIRFRQTASSYQFRLDDVVLTGFSPPIPVPQIIATDSLAAISSDYGGSAATTSSFMISAMDLTSVLTLTPPAGFEISTSPDSFFSPFLALDNAGTLAATSIYLRLAKESNAGIYSGDVLCSATGAVSLTVPMPPSEVRKKSLTVTADDLVKPYGTILTLGPNQSGFSSSGLVGDQTIGSVTLSTFDGSAANAQPGNYGITPISAVGGSFNPANYQISYVMGTLSVVAPSYAQWLAGFSITNQSFTEDTDRDGVVNGLENFLGTSPVASSPSLLLVSATGQAVTLRHSRSNLSDPSLQASYQWSTDLTSWVASGVASGGITVTIVSVTISDLPAPANDLVEATATVTGGASQKLYLRLKVIKP